MIAVVTRIFFVGSKLFTKKAEFPPFGNSALILLPFRANLKARKLYFLNYLGRLTFETSQV